MWAFKVHICPFTYSYFSTGSCGLEPVWEALSIHILLQSNYVYCTAQHFEVDTD